MDLYEDREIVEEYFRRYGRHAVMPSRLGVTSTEIDGVSYVFLSNLRGVLAIYSSGGFLRRSEWPAELAE